jgi:hypothetical protein
MGTLLSAVKCTGCGGAVISQDPLDQMSNWECNDCGSVQKVEQVKRAHDSARMEWKQSVQLARNRLELLEDFIRKYSGAIHPDSCHVIEAKYALVQLYGNTTQLLYHGFYKTV